MSRSLKNIDIVIEALEDSLCASNQCEDGDGDVSLQQRKLSLAVHPSFLGY